MAAKKDPDQKQVLLQVSTDGLENTVTLNDNKITVQLTPETGNSPSGEAFMTLATGGKIAPKSVAGLEAFIDLVSLINPEQGKEMKRLLAALKQRP
jgi:hypothetical protein